MYDDYIKLARVVGVDADGGGAFATTNFGKLFSKRMIWALKNQMYNFDRQMINRLNVQIPLPLFFSDELLYVGAGEKLEIIFGISTNWYRNIIQCVGSFSSVLGDYTVVNKADTFANNTINVAITDMKLYLNRGYITSTHVPRSIKGTYFMKNFSPVVANLALANTTTVTGTFDATGKITHVISAFNVNSGNFPKYSPNDTEYIRCIILRLVSFKYK